MSVNNSTKPFIRLIPYLCILTFWSACKQSSSKESTIKTNVVKAKDTVSVLSFDELMEKALLDDSVTYTNIIDKKSSNDVLFFKSGHVFHPKEKQVLLISKETDGTFVFVTYFDHKGTWKLKDHIIGLHLNPEQFDIKFQDYNFDGQLDCYIQVSNSNGYSISKGHLITIEPGSNFPILHKEARHLGNIRIVGKHIEAEEWEGYNKVGMPNVSTTKYIWTGGRLERMEENAEVE